MDFTAPRNPVRIFSALIVLMSVWCTMGYAQTQDDTYSIPAEVKVSREGHTPPKELGNRISWQELITGVNYPVFPTCYDGLYYVGFQLEYDPRMDKNTQELWLANVSLALLNGEDTIWKKPLKNDMGTQTFVSTVFHQTTLACTDGYRYAAVEKTGTGKVPAENIYLQVLLFKHLEDDFDPTVLPSATANSTEKQATVSWDYKGKSSIAYDIEWVFIADHEVRFTGTTGPQAFSFKEPAGVTVTGTYYTHQMYYPNGRLWYRVRSVGYNPAHPEHRIEGQWAYAPEVISVENHQPDISWQEQTIFAGDGKYKKVVSYYDGSMRQRQTQTNLSTDNVSMVGETLYDYEGRASVTILPVPATDAGLTYRLGFNNFETLNARVDSVVSSGKRQKFNYDNNQLENSTLSTRLGAGQYYSSSNLSTSVLRNYIPDAEGYAYTQTNYTNDGTGRVMRQSGVGKAFKADGDHTTRYYYGEAAPEELARLFGSNVGNASHYKKNLVVDPNGQVSVLYLDQEGRTIATALAGDPPSNVNALSSYTDLQPFTPVTIDVSTKNDKSSGVSRISHKVLNASPNGSYTLRYSLAAFGAQVQSFGCQTCTFDLLITISNPDGAPVALGTIQGNEAPDVYSYQRKGLTATDCDAPATFSDVVFQTMLPEIGDYTITKTLTPTELTFERMSVIIQQQPEVQQQIQAIKDSYVIDPQDCAICTQACPGAEDLINDAIDEVATLDCDNIYQQILQSLRDQHSSDENYVPSEQEINDHALHCKYLLCGNNVDSDVFDKQLSRVQSWDAAVAAGYTDALSIDPFFNNAALSGYPKRTDMQSSLNAISITSVNSSDGSTVAVYQGTLAQITDPLNTAYYVNDNGVLDVAGKHILYLDLMSKRSTLTAAEYAKELGEQHWVMYRTFYENEKRKIKLLLDDYKACASAMEELQITDNLPQTSDGIEDYGAANGATANVSAEELEMSIYSITSACGIVLSEPDGVSVAQDLSEYFNSHNDNFLRVIYVSDLGTDANLVAIDNVLKKYNCSLNSVADVNAVICIRDTDVVRLDGTDDSGRASSKSITYSDETQRFEQQRIINPQELPVTTKQAGRVAAATTTVAVISQAEYNALLDLYNNTNGGGWTNNTGWKDAQANPQAYDVADWFGVAVTDGHVTGLSLMSNNLVGSIPQSIGNLTSLASINLSKNSLTGSIPSTMGNLSNLLYMYLYANKLTGSIPELGNLQKLKFLWLSQNQLTGSIPASLGSLSSLVQLVLEINKFGGTIPVELGNLGNLELMALGGISLTGSIPKELGKLSNLTVLSLGANSLSGSIPSELGSLSKLTALRLEGNQLSGSIPETLGNLTALVQFDLSFNDLSGSIPSSLGNLSKVTTFDLTTNGLTGSIPGSLGNLSNVTKFSLSTNQLDGEIPASLGNLSKVTSIDLGNNHLSGSIPSELGNLNSLNVLILFNNNLTGAIPNSFANLTALTTLWVSGNDLGGIIPLVTSSNFYSLSIYDNAYTFSGIVDFFKNNNRGPAFTIYSPQDSVDKAKKVRSIVGAPVTLVANVDRDVSPACKYQWFKYSNGVSTPVSTPSTTGYTYSISNVSESDIGTKYYYKITNINAQGLILTSRLQTIILATETLYTVCLEYDMSERLTYTINWNDEVKKCMDRAAEEKENVTQLAITKLIEAQISNLYNNYRTNCLDKLQEKFTYTHSAKEYHYTLYYYDQAGSLVQTVPPAGVDVTHTPPAHSLVTRYQYNSFGEVIWQNTPDTGGSQFWYNDKGQTRLSQNAQQRKDMLYSYNRYDEQGRIVESGEMACVSLPELLRDSLNGLSFPSRYAYTLTDITHTAYDFPNAKIQSQFSQRYLRSRISYVEVVDKNSTDTTTTYYSYDVHGNVNRLLQSVPGLGVKEIQYVYGPASSNVSYILYQYGKPDQFMHKYEYDSDSRIVEVSTSSDGFVWNTDAAYSYYTHGLLGRQELGEYRVQGLDSYYTLQGWIKGVNMPYAGDPSGDGTNSNAGKDAYAYTLGYYQGDYKPIQPGVVIVDSRDYLWTRLQENMGNTGLYNGNISWMIADLSKIGDVKGSRVLGVQGMLYKYDQLQRITTSRSLTSYNGTTGFSQRTAAGGAYDEDYSYDPNGNLLTLTRLDNNASLKDDFHYRYYSGTNRLMEVARLSRDTAYHEGAIRSNGKAYRNITVDGNAHADAGSVVELIASEDITISPDFVADLQSDFTARNLGQDQGIFVYDAVGNLVTDYDQGIRIEWTPYGKVRRVRSRGDSVVVSFRYDGSGNRIEKRVVKPDTSYVTHYVRDGRGEVMSIYNDTTAVEQPIYGSRRVGLYTGGVLQGHRTLGKRKYELCNHLGNVLTVITDNLGISKDSIWSKVVTTSDYYPFGLAMEGRGVTLQEEMDTTSTNIPPAAIPLARYALDGNGQDNTGHGFNGTVSGAVPTPDNQGNAGKAYSFDGVNDLIRLANTKDSLAFIQNTGVFTITAFIKLNSLTARSAIIGTTATTAGKGFLLMYENYSSTYGLHQLRFSYTNGVSGKSIVALGAQNAINDTNWHHIAVVGDGKTIRFYVDGQLDGAPTNITFYSTGPSSKDAMIGAVSDLATSNGLLPFNGSIDELNVFKKVLTQAEIRNLAQRIPSGGQSNANSGQYHDKTDYRYAFNGKEADGHGEFGGTVYDYGFRIYNPRIGKFLTIDPLTSKSPFYSPYLYAGDKPIIAIDQDGLLEIIVTIRTDHEDGTSTYERKVYNIVTQEEIDGVVRTPVHVTVMRMDLHLHDRYTSFSGTMTYDYSITRGTGESEAEIADQKYPITRTFQKYAKKFMIDNPLGTGHFVGAMAGQNLETGANISMFERVVEVLDGAVSFVGLGAAGIKANGVKEVNGSILKWGIDFSVEQSVPLIAEKLGLEHNQSIIFTYYLGKFAREYKKGEIKDLIDRILKGGEMAIEVKNAVVDYMTTSGADLNTPKDKDAAVKQVVEGIGLMNLDLKRRPEH